MTNVSEEKVGHNTVGGSVRADGSIRKVLKIKPGYVPMDEQPKYDASKARARRMGRLDSINLSERESAQEARQPGSKSDNMFKNINDILSVNDSQKKVESNIIIQKEEEIGSSEKGSKQKEPNSVKEDIASKLSVLRLRDNEVARENDKHNDKSKSTQESRPYIPKQRKHRPAVRQKYSLDDLENGKVK